MSDSERKCASRSIESPELENWSACMRELSLHILDILQNSIEAGATLVELTIEEDLVTDRLNITVDDDGRGMSEAQATRIFDPFYTTRKTRHVGLGLPLFKAAAERCNGDLIVTSQLGKGTTIRAAFQHSHIDRAPLGDVISTLLSFILANKCDLHYIHRVKKRRQEDMGTQTHGDTETVEFEFHTAAIKAEMGDVPLTHPQVRRWLQEFIAEGEAKVTVTSASLGQP